MSYSTTGKTTALRVFELAINLMDELDDEGSYDTEDTAEYKNRTLAILNVLRGELYPYSDTYRKSHDWEKGRRPIVKTISSFSQIIDMDDYICQSVMPYGLAAHLLMDENPSSAGFFQQRYDELKAMLAVGMPAESEDIIDIYGSSGGIEPYNEFSRWA